LVTLSFFLFQLFRAQGRILLRLDSLERANSVPAPTALTATTRGLAIGTAVKEFHLPDPANKTVSLSDFRGRNVLLVYWSPSCGFCEMMAEELASLQKESKSRNLEIVLITSEHDPAALAGLQATTLLLQGTPSEKYI